MNTKRPPHGGGRLTRIGAIDHGRRTRAVRTSTTSDPKPVASDLLHHGNRPQSRSRLQLSDPGFFSGAKQGIVRIRQGPALQFLEVSTPSYVYPYLQRNITLMKNAETEYEWRRISFKLGPMPRNQPQPVPSWQVHQRHLQRLQRSSQHPNRLRRRMHIGSRLQYPTCSNCPSRRRQRQPPRCLLRCLLVTAYRNHRPRRIRLYRLP